LVWVIILYWILNKNILISNDQHEASNKPDIVDKVCRWLLDQKISGHQNLIKGLSSMNNEDEEIPESLIFTTMKKLNDSEIQYLKKAVNDIKKIREDLKSATGREQLMGYEGAAAHIWFDALARILPKEWKFKGRNRRPPKDPINALMSLTYTMAMGDVHRTVHERGLDPCIGFLHALLPGRESLVLDILEPLRCSADAFVLHLIDCGIDPKKHFTYSTEYGCRLNKEGRKIYFSEWSEFRLEWPYHIIDESYVSLMVSDDDEEEEEEEEYDQEFDDPKIKDLKKCCWWIIKNMISFWDVKK